MEHTSPFVSRVLGDEDRDAVLGVIRRYVATVNDRDGEGNRATMACPHVRLANDEVLVIPDRDGLDRISGFDRLASTGWHRTDLDWADVIQGDERKAHVALQFSRYDAEGNHLVSFESLYVVVKRDGAWAIQARTSFAPKA